MREKKWIGEIQIEGKVDLTEGQETTAGSGEVFPDHVRCIKRLAQIAAQSAKSLSSQKKGDRFIAEHASATISQSDSGNKQPVSSYFFCFFALFFM